MHKKSKLSVSPFDIASCFMLPFRNDFEKENGITIRNKIKWKTRKSRVWSPLEYKFWLAAEALEVNIPRKRYGVDWKKVIEIALDGL